MDRAFAENVLGPMEWGKWNNIIFDQVSQQFEMMLGFNTHIFCAAILDDSQTGEQV